MVYSCLVGFGRLRVRWGLQGPTSPNPSFLWCFWFSCFCFLVCWILFLLLLLCVCLFCCWRVFGVVLVCFLGVCYFCLFVSFDCVGVCLCLCFIVVLFVLYFVLFLFCFCFGLFCLCLILVCLCLFHSDLLCFGFLFYVFVLSLFSRCSFVFLLVVLFCITSIDFLIICIVFSCCVLVGFSLEFCIIDFGQPIKKHLSQDWEFRTLPPPQINNAEILKKFWQEQLTQLCSHMVCFSFWACLQNLHFCWKHYKIVVSTKNQNNEKCKTCVKKTGPSMLRNIIGQIFNTTFWSLLFCYFIYPLLSAVLCIPFFLQGERDFQKQQRLTNH